MKAEVQTGIQELQRQFPDAVITTCEDGAGGAYVTMEPMQVGARFIPTSTWMGFHMPALYPYADIYPVFLGSALRRVDGQAFVPPVTQGASFQGRPAIQVSRRSPNAQQGLQKASTKILKILSFLETF